MVLLQYLEDLECPIPYQADAVPSLLEWLLHHAAPIAEVQEMYVVPQYRSMGVGARLLHALVDFARSCNAENVELSSQKKRVDAHRFYVREGFQNNHLKFQLRLREA